MSIGDNNDFDVTFSALGQTYASREMIINNVAFDVMFVLDMSASMTNYDSSKGRDAVSAINTAMKAFLEGEGNEKNRVGITTFSESASLTLPLGHYTSSASDGDYLQYDEGGWGDNPGFSLTIQGRNGTVSFTGGTYTQSGIATGANALISGMNSVMDDTEHIPVLILITDGVPTFYSDTYWNPTGENQKGNGMTSSDSGDTHGYYTVKSAVYFKEQIASNFRTHYPSSDQNPKFYTIGQDLSGIYEETLLNPTSNNVQSAWNSNRYSKAYDLAHELFANNWEIDDSFSYADGSYTGEMDEQRLQEIMDEIRNDLGDLGVNTDVGESTGERNRITYFETLGEGVQFTGKMTLTVPKYKIVENEIQSLPSAQYTLTAYKEDGTELNPADGPAYLASGGVVTFRDDNHQEELANLSITVRQLSDGMRQMQVDIPPELMAYNVFITKSESGGTVYD